MNQVEIFHINIDIPPRREILLEVQHFYSSDQIEKFRVLGNDRRNVTLEKRLSLTKQPWKIVSADVDMSNTKKAAYIIFQMQERIDAYLKNKIIR